MSPVAPRRARLGLRARAALVWALGGFVLSVTLAVLTYQLAKNTLIDQREDSAVRQTLANARLARNLLRGPDADPGAVLTGLPTGTGSDALLLYGDRWFTSSVAVDDARLPSPLREQVVEGGAAMQRFTVGGDPALAVGVAMPGVDAAYLEVFRFDELDRTLGALSTALVVAASVTTIAAALLGITISGRMLRPLTEVADAARRLARGSLDTRLPPERDPDLDTLVESFNQMADALQQRIQRDARFASDVSHELRSPLTALSGAMEVVKGRRDEFPERTQVAVDVLDTQVRRFERMVLDLLEISRIDAGALRLDTEVVPIGPVVERAVHGIDASVAVVVDEAAGRAEVAVDERRLRQVLANLLENARIHGGGALGVSVRRADDAVRITVDDAGPGVPLADRNRIFERFARGSTARHRAGSGLGLALVSEHVTLHAGRVWAEERPGGGARFVVELPVVDTAAAVEVGR